jgi:hypothetical protein
MPAYQVLPQMVLSSCINGDGELLHISCVVEWPHTALSLDMEHSGQAHSLSILRGLVRNDFLVVLWLCRGAVRQLTLSSLGSLRRVVDLCINNTQVAHRLVPRKTIPHRGRRDMGCMYKTRNCSSIKGQMRSRWDIIPIIK